MNPSRMATLAALLGALIVPASAFGQRPDGPSRDPRLDRLRDAVEVNNPNMFHFNRALAAVTHPSGIEFAEVSEVIRSQMSLSKGHGVVVVSVFPDGLASRAGLAVNDILLSFGSKEITGTDEARKAFAECEENFEVKVIRGGKEKTVRYSGDVKTKRTPATEYWLGIPFTLVDATLRSHLTNLPPGAGLIVNGVVPDSPAAKAGLKKNDVLIAMGGKPLTHPEMLIAQVRNSDGKPIPLEYLRAGKAETATITPEKHEVPDERPFTFDAGPFPFLLDPGSLLQDYDARSGLRVNPYPRGDGKAIQNLNPKDLEVRLQEMRSGIHEALQGKAAGAATRRLEAAIKELTAKVEEVRMSVERMKLEGKLEEARKELDRTIERIEADGLIEPKKPDDR